MDGPTYQVQARDAAQLVHAEALARMMEAVSKPGADPELAVKVFNATTSVAQAVPKDKDPLGNLPVFNITFVNGRISGTPVPELEFVEDLGAFAPTPSMAAMAGINLDLIAQLEEQL